MQGRGRKLEGVAVALPYLVTFRSRLLTLAAQQGRTAAELVRSSYNPLL